jgi:protein involved in polysaccharide export with SLBB domain
VSHVRILVALICRPLIAAMGLLVLAGHLASPAAADPYLLGPQDKVRLKVYEWRASRDAIFEWTALNDVFTVGADGSLGLPFAGVIPAEGRTVEALAGVVAQNLVRTMGLGQAPDVAVEVVQFRPFYILGRVMQPGEFPYRPGLNVLEAVGIAGGLRVRPEGSDRIEREIISARGDISQLSLTTTSLLARKARLEAESNGADDIAFPPELTKRPADEAAALMMEHERSLFLTRKESVKTQLQALADLRSFLDRETESLQKQLGFLDEQIASVAEELKSVTSLVEQGLAAAPRQMALERALLQVRSDRLSAETSLLRASQEASRTQLSVLELRNSRATEVANDLRDTQIQLSEIQRKSDVALMLLHDSEVTEPRLANARLNAERAEPIFTIVRPTETGALQLAAGETTQVQPGDTIKVELPLPPEALPDSTETSGSITGSPMVGTTDTVIR